MDHRAACTCRSQWPASGGVQPCWLRTATRGRGGGIQFWGSSFVCGAQGELLAQAGSEQPERLMVQLDLQRSEDVRRIWPFLRDRRIDAYGEILHRYRD